MTYSELLLGDEGGGAGDEGGGPSKRARTEPAKPEDDKERQHEQSGNFAPGHGHGSIEQYLAKALEAQPPAPARDDKGVTGGAQPTPAFGVGSTAPSAAFGMANTAPTAAFASTAAPLGFGLSSTAPPPTFDNASAAAPLSFGLTSTAAPPPFDMTNMTNAAHPLFSLNGLAGTANPHWLLANLLLGTVGAAAQQQLPQVNSEQPQNMHSAAAEAEAAPESHACPVCRESVKLDSLRAHLGAHMLAGHLSTGACGFCGGNCKPALKGKQAKEGCPRFKRFSSGPCTRDRAACNNHVMQCGLNCPDGRPCKAIIWSYNQAAHERDVHGKLPGDGQGVGPTVGPLERAYLERLNVRAPRH